MKNSFCNFIIFEKITMNDLNDPDENFGINKFNFKEFRFFNLGETENKVWILLNIFKY